MTVMATTSMAAIRVFLLFFTVIILPERDAPI